MRSFSDASESPFESAPRSSSRLAFAFVGSASGVSYRLGDTVTVRLVEAAPVAGALRFELLSEGRQSHRGARAGHSPRDGQGEARRGLHRGHPKRGRRPYR